MSEVAAADPAQVVGVFSGGKAEQDVSHTTVCRALGVSESWFYKRRDKPVTARDVRRGRLAELEACHTFLDADDTLVVPSLERYGR
ncbi:hypothetical protein [Streptomyces mirabilis]